MPSILTDIIGAISYRMALAGGWIDQPFVSKLNSSLSELERRQLVRMRRMLVNTMKSATIRLATLKKVKSSKRVRKAAKWRI